jgi:hypothetical protein
VKLNRRNISLLITAFLVIGSARLPATPVTYHFDDPGWGFAGQGYFTFDLGTALGTYSATGVSGGAGSFLAVWDSVTFAALEGTTPTLEFRSGSVSVYYAAGLTIDASTGAEVSSWDNFVSTANRGGVSITAAPEGGSSLLLTALVLGGLAWVASRGRKQMALTSANAAGFRVDGFPGGSMAAEAPSIPPHPLDLN